MISGQGDAGTAAHALHRPTPMATETCCAGNSSRMIAKLSGNTAPPTPWTARNTISAR